MRFAQITNLGKNMFTKIHQILGKIFLSGASFFWASCDSASSAEELGPLIDIEQEMAKLTPPDTTGLRGQCASVKDYCDVIQDMTQKHLQEIKLTNVSIQKIFLTQNVNVMKG